MTALDEPVTISVAGHPQGKGRARSFIQAGKVVTTTPPKTRSYEGMVRFAATAEMAGRLPTDAPIEITLTAILDVPSSWPKWKRARALANDIAPTKKPDIDNIIKAFIDAMNGVVFKDDCQIVRGNYAKVFGPAPMVVATVRPMRLRRSDVRGPAG